MQGDARRRYCDQCELHVTNLSFHTWQEREKILTERDGRLCVAYFRDEDGEPAAIDKPGKLGRLIRAAAALGLATTPALLAGCMKGAAVPPEHLQSNEPQGAENAEGAPEEPMSIIMGEFCYPEETIPNTETQSPPPNDDQAQAPRDERLGEWIVGI